MKLRLPIRILLFSCFQLISVFAFSQTIGGRLASDDFDGDGIINSIDIDDDNDGIPDAEEYCKSSILLPATNTISTITEFRVPSGWTISNSSPDIATTAYSIYGGWVGGCTGAAPAAPNGHTSWVNFYSNTQEAFKTTVTGLTVGKSYILKVYYAKFASTPALGQITVKLGSSVIDQYTPTLGCGWETHYISFTASATTHDIQFQNTGVASPMQNASVSVSADPLYEVCDTDNDGLPNHLDLDSDGDGCTDAKEGNVPGTLRNGDVKNGANGGVVTTTTNMAGAISGGVGTYGANGLANEVETSAESGIINYISSYTSYALSANLNTCTGIDSDGDGVSDLTDLDDDNDGILDLTEGYGCATLTNDRQIFNDPVVKQFNLVVNGDFEQGDTGFNTTYVNVGSIGTCGSYIVAPFGWASSMGSLSEGNALQINADCSSPFTEFWSQSINVKPNTNYKLGFSIKHGNPATVSYSINGGALTGNFATTANWVSKQSIINSGSSTSLLVKLFETSGAPNSADFIVDDIFLIEVKDVYCSGSMDTDNDGIFNHLDLDSDGDGCPDAKEAGVSGTLNSGAVKNGFNGAITSTTTLNEAVAAGPYGSNGLANGVETSAESGSIRYFSKYTPFALAKNLSVCSDFDNDGIADPQDIDDDNDGTLDAVESPSCFYSSRDWLAGLRSDIQVSTDLVMSNYYQSPKELVDGDNGTTSASWAVSFVASTTPAKTVYAFKMPMAVELKTIYLGYINANTHFNANTVLRLEGSNDNSSWTILGNGYSAVTSVPGVVGVANANSFTVTQNTGKYLFYRIYWVSGGGVGTTGYTNEVYFETPDTYIPSVNPKINCSGDTDGDGVFNFQDLDSDADGCSDALEAGATTNQTANFQFSFISPTNDANNNGLIDTKEGVTAGTINYNSYYNSYALTASINACLDSDQDGVNDVVDLDDDNDGILDRAECDMRPGKILFAGSNENFSTMRSSLFAEFDNNKAPGATIVQSNIIETATVPDGFYDGYDMVVFGGAAFNTIHANHWAALQTAIQNKTSKAFIIQSDNCCVVANQNGLMNVLNNVFGTKYDLSASHPAVDQTFTLNNANSYSSVFTTNALDGNNYYPILNVDPSDILFYSPSVAGSALAGMKQIPGTTSKNQFVAWFVDGTITQGAPWYTANQNKIATAFYNAYNSTTNLTCDTDADGIANHLDLDSDGDGCADALESGITSSVLTSGTAVNLAGSSILSGTLTSTLSNAVVATVGSSATTFGNNGFANSLETSNESGVYNSTYNYPFAISKNYAACADFDHDNITDIVDIDDDNDGILDAIESPACFYTADGMGLGATNRTGILKLTSELTLNSVSRPLTNMIDNPLGATILYTDFLNAQSAVNKNVVTVEFPRSVKLSEFTFNYNSASTIFGASSSATLRGSNDGITWLDLASKTLNSTSETGNITKFTVTNNAAKYKYYRVYSTAGTLVSAGQLKDISFTAPTYNASEYPTLACEVDDDGDGILNHQDLDSDDDGCNDASEAIVTMYNIAVPLTGNVGANGFLNTLETGTDSGIYSGTYTYSYAKLAYIKACLDTDGDLVPDIIDIDDDNDGITDIDEGNFCVPPGTFYIGPAYFKSVTAQNFTVIGTTATPLSDMTDGNISKGVSGNFNWTSQSAPIVIDINLNFPVIADGFFIANDNGVVGDGIKNATIKLYNQANQLIAQQSINPLLNGATGAGNELYDKYAFSKTYVGVKRMVLEVAYSGITTGAAAPNYQIREIGMYRDDAFCTERDTDLDGTPDQLDADSDNDGCNDAYESGAVSSNVTTVAGTYGVNGLSSLVETSDLVSAITNYASSYYFLALQSARNKCTDSDTDGVVDIDDIDDDNDGILDHIESPNCFYKLVDWNISDKSNFALVSSDLATTSNVFNSSLLTDNLATDPSSITFSTSNAQSQIGKAIYKVNFFKPVKLDAWYIQKTSATQIFASTASSLMVQGSNDNTTWTNLLASAIASPADATNVTVNGNISLPNSNKFTISANAGYYKYYRIYGVGSSAATILGGSAEEFYFDLNTSSYNSSLFPNPTCSMDMDGDRVPNHLDLDSDGDGCTDAKETAIRGTLTSGAVVNLLTMNAAPGTATTTTSLASAVVSSTYGANGFANSLETANESGIYSGTYTYNNAVDPFTNACVDTDGDGVTDIIDLDDDNDGVLDNLECPPFDINKLSYAARSFTVTNGASAAQTFPAAPDGLVVNIWSLDNSFNVRINGTNLTYPSELEFWTGAPTNALFEFLDGTAYTAVWGLTGTGSKPLIRVYIDKLGRVKVYGSRTSGGVLEEMRLRNGSFNTLTLNRNSTNTFQIGQLVVAQTFVTGDYGVINAPNCDFDGDGVPNGLDLDSDGDGCPDAKESGVTGTLSPGNIQNLANNTLTTTSNVASSIVTGTYGANGYADALETSNESGISNYVTSYLSYALNSNFNLCKDFDNDGVADIVDIDDDNDGILDAIESPACFNTATEAKAVNILSTELEIYNNNSITNASDNVLTTYSAFNPNINWVGKELFRFKPIVAGNIAISGVKLDLYNWALSNGSTNTFKLQGSTDNGLTWADLSGAVSSTGTTGSLTISNTLNPSVKYGLFRIVGVVGVSYYGGVNEISLVLPSSYASSQYPKVTCTIDTDNDGTPNHLDLDSDGDGCPDATEAGVIGSLTSGTIVNRVNNVLTSTSNVASSIASGTYGSNGFADALETSTESGVYTSVYSYYYAINTAFNMCRDSDGDGSKDIVDIDDDNDGVLDAIESPTCFTSSSDLAIPLTLTSEIDIYNGNIPSKANDTNLTTYSAFNPSINWVGKEIFRITPNVVGPIAISGIKLDLYNWALSNGTGNTFKLQGSKDDGASWTDLSAAVSSTATSGLFTISNTINPSVKYALFRIIGVAGTSYYGGVNELTIVLPSTYSASMYPVGACSSDTDGDGVPNHLDLDSDGDGCPDAKEATVKGTLTTGDIINLVNYNAGAGSATSTTSNVANSIAAGSYGANGFADALETSSESGVYSYTYVYKIASDRTLNGCIDSDNDGLGDVLDLDDDNDGVLDTVEQINCITSGIDLTTLTFSGTAISAKTASTFTTAGGDVWKSSYSDQNLKLPISLKFKHNSTTGYEMFGLLPVAAAQTTANWNDGAYKFYPQVTNTYGYFTAAWDFGPIAISSTDELSIDISSTGYVTAAINGVTKKAFQGTTSDYKLAISAYRASSLSDIILTDATRPANFSCSDIDTDTDGIPNRIDLDSDGDGCPDAKESRIIGTLSSGTITNKVNGNNVTTNNVANAIAAGAYGDNGFANSLETATESGLYTGTYLYYFATDATVSACLDTDADGVTDMFDLDDDNDGVLDTVECPLTNILVNGTFTGNSNGWTANANWVWKTGDFVWNSADNVSNNLISQTFAKPIFNAESSNVDILFDVNTNGTGWSITSSGTATLDVILNNTTYATITNPNGGTTASVVAKNGATVNVSNFNIVTTNVPSTKIIISVPRTVFTNSNTIGFNFGATVDDIGIDNVFIGTQVGTCDTDADGKVNSKDLDSDGDGCSDASEAKTVSSLTATTVSGAYGNNGFANSIETATESGLYSGTYFYSRATDPTIKACLDSDYDGVPDLDDVDDDNDGILDTNECISALSQTFPTTGGNTNSLTDWTVGGTYASSGSWINATGRINLNANGLEFRRDASTTSTITRTISNLPANSEITLGNLYWFNTNAADNSVVATLNVKLNGVTYATIKTGAANTAQPTITVANGASCNLYLLPSTSANTTSSKSNLVIKLPNATIASATLVFEFIASTSAGEVDDIGFASVAINSCAADTDGDGIPDQLDLDSDGDGCSDANEAYGLSTAHGTDGNQQFGTNPLTVDATGKVSGATYTATSVNVLTAGSASTFTAQPTDQSINVGGTAVFSAALTAGSGTTSYQWQVSTNGGMTWSNVTNSSMYSGAGTTTLTVANVPLSMKGYRYRLNVAQSNYVCGNITSSVARLTMDNTPIVVDDNVTIAEDTPVSGNVLTNDKGSGNPASSISVTSFKIGSTTYTVGQTASISGVGSITINTNGTYTFTPTANYNGTLPLIEYTATDANGGTDVGALNITVTPVNDAPVAVDDIKSTNENTTASGNVLTDGTADSDVDGNSLTIIQFSINGVTYNPGDVANIPGKGSITMNANGSYTFTPTAGYSGAVPYLDYTLSDGNGGSDVGRLTITINSVNDAPLATDDIVTINQNTTATGNLLTNDADVDAGSTLTVTTFSFTINGTTYTNTTGATLVTMPGIGTIQISANGAYSFVPTGTYTGTVPPISYTLSDGSLTDIGLLDIFVAPVNFDPVANADTQTSAEDTPATGNVLTNDTDANNNTLTVTQYSFTVSGVTYTYPAGSTNVVPGAGTFVVNANGTYVFTPFPNYNGSVPVITYVISDANGGTATSTVSITITNVNDAPIAVNDDNLTTLEDTALSGNVLSNDSDPDGNAITVSQFVVNGTSYSAGTTATIAGVGTLLINSNGAFTFTPLANYNGPVPTITYTAVDASGGTDTATLNIAVTPVNDLPVVTGETLTASENVAITGNLLTNDTDVETATASLTITQFTIAGVGTATAATYPAGSIVDIPNVGTVIVNADGTFTFTPVRGYFGTPPVITYVVSDGNGGVTNGTLAITVTPVNDPPVVAPESVQIQEDAIATGNLLSNDTDPENNTLSITQFTIAGISGTFTSTASIPGVGTITINADGTYTFTPTANYNGIVPAIEYTVSDGLGGTANGNLTIVVASVNDAPIVANETKSAPVNTAITDNVLTNDRDVEASALSVTKFTIAGVDYTAGTTATITGVGTIVMNADGTFTFTPATNYVGSAPLVTYTVSDGTATSTGTLSLTITPIDADGDGIPDEIEKGPGSTPRDTDNDGTPDYLDTDSDGDGILDNAEDAVCVGFMPCTPTDTDGDGTPDYRDLDSDGDGIPDVTEGTTDTDGDGVPNYRDTDSDGDGILDSVEGTTDTDGDGVPNYKDLDSDGDGISDATEGTTDTDGDGTPNYKDTDSDGDGISDAIEGTTDTDGDGTPNYLDTDSDGDGISDAIEKGPNATPVDTDGDGTPDYKDLDSDNDGILDSAETATDTDGDGIPNFRDLDSDGDGILDAVEGTVDTDGDGIPNYKDVDSDGDGIPDSIEKGPNSAPADTDGDGIPDYKDLDTDGDGIPDAVEDAGCTGTAPCTPTDTDGDGIPNFRDLDSDGDGISDAMEKGPNGATPVDTDSDGTPDYLDVDSDGDGISDATEGTTDTDGDGIPDYRDTDSDNDGISDAIEKGPTATPVDTDGDGTPDYRDLDSDGDGKTDQSEGSIDTDNDGTPNFRDLDSDGDGVLDAVDVCPLVDGLGSANGCPPDADGDGLIDAVDSDDDNDGILDTVEAAACSPSAVDCDTDGDGIPNRLDADSDGDGISDVVEAGGTDADNNGIADGNVDSNGVPSSANGGVTPPNTDGTGNSNPYDTDSDGDGISDAIEKGTGATLADTDNDNIPDYLDTDSDGDGISDAIEKGTGAAIADTDNDGVPDFRDLDSDGDGIIDATEGTTDSDNDGIPNFRDLDSDGDGILDSVEKGTGNTLLDSDGDNIPNYLDADSDADGIPDAIEGTVDTDGDGTPDYIDTDSDGDGILDSVEDAGCTGTAPCTPTDTDGDGVPNFRDLDSDGDGITDAIEGTTDTDGDSIPNYLDPDSDGDGISDLIEGNVDTDGDGTPNYLDVDTDGDGIPDSIEKGAATSPADTDGDGTPDYLDTDTDGDGIPDSVEDAGCSGTAPCTPTDTDGDGIPNYKDLDSDGDGIPDSVEKGANGATPDNTDGATVPDYLDTDSDNDGILDAVERGINGNVPLDTDGDGIPDYKEIDSDNDGIPDAVEGTVDTDGDGIPDYRDTDSDNDGITDAVEDAGCTGTAPCTPTDTDGDGIPNYKDLDSDADNKPDQFEGDTDYDGDTTPNYLDPDSDGDNINDIDDQCPLLPGVIGNNGCPLDTDGDGVYDVNDLDDDNDGLIDTAEAAACSPAAPDCDTDGDGIPNRLDPDSDNDGISDVIESNGTDIDADGKVDGSVDADGVPSSTNGGLTPPNTDGTTLPDPYDLDSDGDGIKDSLEGTVDTDGDGIPNYRDLDSDGDGIPDSVERGTGAAILDTDGDGTPDYKDLDSDGDGIPDSVEKGPNGATPLDTDGDGIPNYRDLDSDGDGIPDNIEGTTDTDGDGIPNYLDVDSDGDGITDAVEKGLNGNSPIDTDGDGTPDYKDLDSDNDGIPDSVEGTTDTDGDGVPNYRDLDSDGDGITDAVEKGANGATPVDTDGDGIPDYKDTDSDDDGKLDAIEKGTGLILLDTDRDGIPDYRDVDNYGVSDFNVTNVNVPVSGSVKTNDTVPTGSSYGQPAALAGATLVMNAATGTYTFTSNTPGKYVYYVPVCGPNQSSNCPQTPLEITVLDPLAIDKPAANNDFAILEQGGSATVAILTNDKAGDLGKAIDASSLVVITAPSHGTAVINSNGSITYTPTANFVGVDSLVYRVCDTNVPSQCQSATAYFTVEPAGLLVKTGAVDDFSILRSSPDGSASVTGNVLSNDLNGAGATLTANLVSGPSNAQGTFTMNAAGNYTFTPSAGFSGPVDIVYEACGGSPVVCTKATLHILVEPLPALVNDATTAFANVPKTGDLSTNESVPAGTTFGQPTQVTGATITVGPSGTYTFTATAAGTYTYTIPVCAPGQIGTCPTETLVITVTAPGPVDDTASAFANVPKTGDISTNDSNPAGTTFGQPAALTGATITVAANGTYTFTATVAGTYTYTIPVCAPGQTVDCPTETLVITVTEPGPVDDTASAFANVPKTGDISTNDSNPAGTTFGQPAALTGATITVSANGTYTFTATAAGTYTYTIPVCAPGQTSNCPTETLVITVTEPGPVDDATTAFANVPKTGNVSTNDSNPAGTTFGQPAAQTGATITVAANGTYTFTATAAGTYTYTIPVCAPGQTSNCPTETLVITVTEPGPVDDTASAFANVPKTGDISTNDSNPAGTTFGQPAALTGATITVAANGTYTFTATVAGTYTYTIPVCAPGQTVDCPTETLVITVTEPGPVDDTASAFANVPKTGDISTNDSNPAGTTFGQPAALTGATITVAANGTYTFTATVAGTYTYTIPLCAPGQTVDCPTETLVITVTEPGPVDDTASAFANVPKTGDISTNDSNPAGTTFGQPAAQTGATITVNADGTYTFTATAAGTYTYTIPVCAPGQTSNCPTELLVITVTEPTPANDTALTTKNTAISGNVATNDSNPAGTTYGQPAAQTGATITVNADGTYSFTATVAGTYTYTIPVCAPGQTSDCPTQTLAITVTDPTVPYTAPTTNPDIDATNINVPVSGNVSTNDAPGATYGQPAQQTGATITVNANGTYSFTATIQGVYTYLVPACPTGQTTNCPSVPLVITVSDPLKDSNSPVANGDVATVNAGSSVTTKVLANDKAANSAASLNPASLAIVTNGANGTAVVNSDGTITYTPKAGFTGVDEITYKICDNSTPALCATAKVSYTVQPVAEPAKTFAADDYNSSPAGTPVTGSVLTNDKNTAGETLTATIVSGVSAAEGTLVFNADGTYVFTPAPGFSGPVDVVYTVCSASNVCAKATLHLVVNPPKILTPDFNATLIGIPVNGSAATNDVLVAGTTYGQPASISGATIRMNPDGTYSFSSTTPGTYEYLVPVCAKAQTTNCPLIPLVITVTDPNAITNPPIANADVVTVEAGSPVTTNVLANDQAANFGGVLVVSTLAITNAPLNGTAKVNADGTITYTPKPGFVGTDVLTYTICDNSQPALCKTAKVYYTVGASASKNLLASDDYGISQGGMVSGNVLGNDKSSTGSTLTATAITNVDPAKGNFSLSPSGAYTFTPAAGYVGPVDIVYSVCSADGICTKATLHITVVPVPEMIAPQAITPNGDGKNDTLIFRGLPALNIENRLTIYNRWGNIVFSTGNYQNNWSGQTDNAFGAMATDSQLPDGTYYYILDFFGARPNLGNYVYLDRSSK